MRSAIWPAALLLGLTGCVGPSTGPIVKPPLYPDRTSAVAVVETFLWAWKTGDVPVLAQCLGGGMRNTLRHYIRYDGLKKTAAYYRDPELQLLDVDWIERSTALARVRLVLSGSKTPRAEVIFYCVRRELQDWTVAGKKVIPR